jgi:ribosome-binding factor A
MGSDGQQTAALNALRHAAGLMRSKLTGALSLRVTPFLKFHLDEQLKKEVAVLEAIQRAAQETAQMERRRAAAADPNVSGSPQPTPDREKHSL